MGSTLFAGSPFELRWPRHASVSGATVQIKLYQGSSASATAVIASSVPNNGSYIWTPPQGTTGGDFRVRVQSRAPVPASTVADDYSDVFAIAERLTLGEPCSVDSDCASFNCVGGYCCAQSTCSGAARVAARARAHAWPVTMRRRNVPRASLRSTDPSRVACALRARRWVMPVCGETNV